MATTDRPIDDAIDRFCREEGVACFRGSADNVAERALRCAEHFGLSAFARVCGDSPFFPDDVICRLFDVQTRTGCDVACNVFPRTYPVGASVEVVATHAMRRLVASPLTAEESEHCTQYLYSNPSAFYIHNDLAPNPAWRSIRLAVDTFEDLDRAEWIVRQFDRDPATIAWETLLNCSRAYPGGLTSRSDPP